MEKKEREGEGQRETQLKEMKKRSRGGEGGRGREREGEGEEERERERDYLDAAVTASREHVMSVGKRSTAIVRRRFMASNQLVLCLLDDKIHSLAAPGEIFFGNHFRRSAHAQ